MRIRVISGILIFFLIHTHLIAQTPRFSTPVTFNDWFLYASAAMPKDRGPRDVNYVMNKMSDEGVERVYMRILNGGEVYSTSLLKSSFRDSLLIDKSKDGCDPETCKKYYNFKDINDAFFQHNSTDFLEYAVKQGKSEGLEMFGWFSLMEEMHVGIKPRSWFADAYPQYLEKDASGKFWQARLSFAHPQVRDHKLSLIFDYVNAYGLDGVLLDFTRLGFDEFKDNIPKNVSQCKYMNNNSRDQDAVSLLGYAVGSEQTVSNNNQSWIDTRAQYLNQFMSDLRDTLATIPNREVKINAIVLSTDHLTSKKGDLIDWGNWVTNDLVDGIAFLMNNVTDGVMCGWSEFNEAPEPIASVKNIIAERRKEVETLNPGSDIEVISAFFAYKMNPDMISVLNNYSISEGADEVMWWESHALQQQNRYDEYRWDLNNLYANHNVVPKSTELKDTTLGSRDLKVIVGEVVEINDVSISEGSHLFVVAGDEITFQGPFTVEDNSQVLMQVSPISDSTSDSWMHDLRTVVVNNQEQPTDIGDMLVIYPNQVSGSFRIEFKDQENTINRIKVFDTRGQLLDDIQSIDNNPQDLSYGLEKKDLILVFYANANVTCVKLLFE